MVCTRRCPPRRAGRQMPRQPWRRGPLPDRTWSGSTGDLARAGVEEDLRDAPADEHDRDGRGASAAHGSGCRCLSPHQPDDQPGPATLPQSRRGAVRSYPARRTGFADDPRAATRTPGDHGEVSAARPAALTSWSTFERQRDPSWGQMKRCARRAGVRSARRAWMNVHTRPGQVTRALPVCVVRRRARFSTRRSLRPPSPVSGPAGGTGILTSMACYASARSELEAGRPPSMPGRIWSKNQALLRAAGPGPHRRPAATTTSCSPHGLGRHTLVLVSAARLARQDHLLVTWLAGSGHGATRSPWVSLDVARRPDNNPHRRFWTYGAAGRRPVRAGHLRHGGAY
jgi:hypothetical protein